MSKDISGVEPLPLERLDFMSGETGGILPQDVSNGEEKRKPKTLCSDINHREIQFIWLWRRQTQDIQLTTADLWVSSAIINGERLITYKICNLRKYAYYFIPSFVCLFVCFACLLSVGFTLQLAGFIQRKFTHFICHMRRGLPFTRRTGDLV